MLILELDGIELDRCASCGGTWVDTGEMELLLERSGEPSDPLCRAIDAADSRGPTPLRCPRCRRKLRELAIAVGEGIVVDACARGDGMWCDAGEMRAILAAFSSGSPVTGFLAQVDRSRMAG